MCILIVLLALDAIALFFSFLNGYVICNDLD